METEIIDNNTMEELVEPQTLNCEYHCADNGAIFIDTDDGSILVCNNDNNSEEKMLGQYLRSVIEEYLNINLVSSIKLTIQIEQTTPRY